MTTATHVTSDSATSSTMLRATAPPVRRPDPGRYLRAAIKDLEAALASSSGSTPSPRRLAELLRSALAHTAACGDTCRVRPAADAVRHAAAELLATGSVERDLPELLRVRTQLLSLPFQPSTPVVTAGRD